MVVHHISQYWGRMWDRFML